LSGHVLVLDLDDTLYDELSFVRSGFCAVAAWGEERLGLDRAESLTRLMGLLESQGRGRVFDDWLEGRGSVRAALEVYRRHDPDIVLWPAAQRLLARHRDAALYLVTDGHKGVQARKVTALDLWDRMRRVYLTSRYGTVHAKPSPRCFELVARRERVPLSALVHVADNPAKDFVGLNPLGVTTVRVLTGQHAETPARPGAEAAHRIPDLDALPGLLDDLGIALRSDP
jgi:putative hydrolase of the HAD superfamily